MNTKFIETLVKYMLILFLLVTVAVQATRFFSVPVTTHTAHLTTIYQSTSGPGLVFRDEILLEESGASVVSSLFDDAQRVLVGEPVVELLPPGTYVGSRSLLRQTQREIDMLEQAQNTYINHLANTDALGRDIQRQLGFLVQMSATGQYEDAETLRSNLTSLLNQRQIAIGKEQNFQERISVLSSERDRLLSDAARGATGVVNAPRSGFYARSVDGLENILTLNLARTGGFSELKSLIENTAATEAQRRAGRIITSHNWYVAVVAYHYEIQGMRRGQSLDLLFEATGTRVPATLNRILSDSAEEKAVLIFHSNHVSEETVNLRVSDVRLDFRRHEGIRVDAQALRFVDGERGVFTLTNNVVRFKRVDPVYEEPGFILSRPPLDPHDTFTLRKYDQIIIRGVDLEDGRVLG